MKIHYLTWLHEKTGKHQEHISLAPTIKTINQLIEHLTARGGNYEKIFQNKDIIYVAINGELASHDATINDQDEISFFSGMAGG